MLIVFNVRISSQSMETSTYKQCQLTLKQYYKERFNIRNQISEF